MAKIVNLNRVRKLRSRSDARARATANAAKFGLSGAEREAEEARQARDRHRLDQHRREPGPGEDGPDGSPDDTR